jgi:MYXO-CTERM domain-containing protein
LAWNGLLDKSGRAPGQVLGATAGPFTSDVAGSLADVAVTDLASSSRTGLMTGGSLAGLKERAEDGEGSVRGSVRASEVSKKDLPSTGGSKAVAAAGSVTSREDDAQPAGGPGPWVRVGAIGLLLVVGGVLLRRRLQL